MATEADVQAVERARLEAIVAEYGTESERDCYGVLVIAHGMGVSVPLQSRLEQFAQRAERRHKLRLPLVECVGDPPNRYCSCLEQALDQSREEDGAKIVRASAAELHWSEPPRRPEPLPSVEDDAVASSVKRGTDASHDSRRGPESQPQSEPPFRVVKRTPKWWDEPDGFLSKRF